MPVSSWGRMKGKRVPQRAFWMWLNFVFNRVDHSRVADVGPDRAAAEWILRLGGSVKFGSFESWTTDYNRMPAEPRETTRLEAINASGISITNNGLEHLGTVRMALKTWEDPPKCVKS
jgi:H+-transporting ATP synthase F0 complex subunit s